jgi:hypothetical protein
MAELHALKAGRTVAVSSGTVGFRSRHAAEMRGAGVDAASTADAR